MTKITQDLELKSGWAIKNRDSGELGSIKVESGCYLTTEDHAKRLAEMVVHTDSDTGKHSTYDAIEVLIIPRAKAAEIKSLEDRFNEVGEVIMFMVSELQRSHWPPEAAAKQLVRIRDEYWPGGIDKEKLEVDPRNPYRSPTALKPLSLVPDSNRAVPEED